MPRDRPDAQELIATAAEQLAVKVRPALEGHDAFEALISANLLAIALRELELGPALNAADEAALAALLGREQPLEELEQLLATEIRDGELDGRFAEVLAVLRRSARERVLIANPDYVHEEG